MTYCLRFLLCFVLCALSQGVHAQRLAKILEHKDRIRITKMDILNSSFRETNLSISPDGKYLFFMSMRGGQAWSQTYMEYKGAPVWDGDIWYSVKTDGRWAPPKCMPEGINTSSGEDEPNVSSDGNTVYYQSWNSVWDVTGGPYYKAQRRGSSWGRPEGLGGGITEFFRFMKATDGMTLSPDERLFLVAAARNDYDENMDIYLSRRGAYGWQFCRRLPISTSGDERSIFLAGDGKTLYFASDAYGGLGGLDIYKTTLINDSTLGEVINLGAPFNTPQDDFGFILTADGNEAYFVRDGDIYFADLTEASDEMKPVLPEDVQLTLSGRIRDSLTRQGLAANIILLDSRTKRLIRKVNADAQGRYRIPLPNANRAYDQLVFMEGYKKIKRELRTKTAIENQTYRRDHLLAPPDLPEPLIAEQPPEPEPAPTPSPEPEAAKPQAPSLTQITPTPKEDLLSSQPHVSAIQAEAVEDPYSFTGVAKNNLILLLDVSASMRQSNKLPLLKRSLAKLLEHMRAEDRISVIVYSGEARVVLSGVSAVQQDYILSEIDKLRSGGATKGKGALRRAYKIAEENFIGTGNNRIILATDGYFDVPDLYRIAERNADEQNIVLSVFAFGKLPDERIEELQGLAQRGKGNYANINSTNVDAALLREAKAVRSDGP